MAETVLVGPDIDAARRLTALLDADGYSPRAVLWVHSAERDGWRLWMVPPSGVADKRAFYLRVACVQASHTDVQTPDSGELQFVEAGHRAIVGLGKFIRIRDGAIPMRANMFDGFFLPDCVVLRMDL